jgi:type VI secretion system protein ImpG
MVPDELLSYYHAELGYLRRAGAEFTRMHPKAAARLELGPEECPDPHVERLIESVAFLTGRIRRELDRELPEMAAAAAGGDVPHFLHPVPAMDHRAAAPRSQAGHAGRRARGAPRHADVRPRQRRRRVPVRIC